MNNNFFLSTILFTIRSFFIHSKKTTNISELGFFGFVEEIRILTQIPNLTQNGRGN